MRMLRHSTFLARSVALTMVLAAAALLSACATTGTTPEPVAESVAAQPAAPATTPTATPSRATAGRGYDQLYALAWMQTSTEYQAIVAGTYAQAKAQLVGLVSARALGGALAQTSTPTMPTTGRNALMPSERTNDVPEDPLAIIDEIVAGMDGEPVVEPDRGRAIEQAVELATAGDVVVIAGKGHEQGQEFEHGRKEPFDDRTVAREALRSRVAT